MYTPIRRTLNKFSQKSVSAGAYTKTKSGYLSSD